jgi:hypothetical protein
VIKYVESGDYMQAFDCDLPRPNGECWNPQVYGMIVLNTADAGVWDYSLRFNATTANEGSDGWNYFSDDVSGAVKTRAGFGAENVDPLSVEIDLTPQEIYTNNGFMTLQLLLDRYIINECYVAGNCESEVTLPTLTAADKENEMGVLTGYSSQFLLNVENWVNGELYLPQSVHAMPLPSQAYVINGIYADISSTFALLYILILLPPLSGILTDLVMEKETKMRECLRIYGIGNGGMVGSWYVWYTLKFFCTAVLMAIASVLQLFPNSDVVVLFFYYFFFLLSIMGFGFMASQLFDKSKTASVVGTLLWFVFYFMESLIAEGELAQKQIASLLAPIAFAQVGEGGSDSVEGEGEGEVV